MSSLARLVFLIALAQLQVGSRVLAQPQDGKPALKPPGLEKGDTIGVVAPASPLSEEKVLRARKYLQKLGYAVKLSYGYRDAQGYLAGKDENRAAELNAMFSDTDVKAIFCLRGGYGSPRILDLIDYDNIRRNPKIFVGYSDITALLNAMQARTGLVVFHGPMLGEMSAHGGLSPYSSEYFWGAFRASHPQFKNWGRGRNLKTLVKGTAEGVLVGGNLSVLTSTIGTPYQVNTKDAILFIEEVNEEPFRVDRMLNQLRLSGKLAELRGVLICQFTRCRGAGKSTRKLEVIFDEYFGRLGVPVLSGYPAGHVTDQATLPMGSRVRLDATGKTLSLIEPPVGGKAEARARSKPATTPTGK